MGKKIKPGQTVWIVEPKEYKNKMTESEIEHQIEQDEDEESEILGYQCLACGNIQDRNTGFGCDVCTGRCLEEWYE